MCQKTARQIASTWPNDSFHCNCSYANLHQSPNSGSQLAEQDYLNQPSTGYRKIQADNEVITMLVDAIGKAAKGLLDKTGTIRRKVPCAHDCVGNHFVSFYYFSK
jgi:hypothetical protein